MKWKSIPQIHCRVPDFTSSGEGSGKGAANSQHSIIFAVSGPERVTLFTVAFLALKMWGQFWGEHKCWAKTSGVRNEHIYCS